MLKQSLDELLDALFRGAGLCGRIDLGLGRRLLLLRLLRLGLTGLIRLRLVRSGLTGLVRLRSFRSFRALGGGLCIGALLCRALDGRCGGRDDLRGIRRFRRLLLCGLLGLASCLLYTSDAADE